MKSYLHICQIFFLFCISKEIKALFGDRTARTRGFLIHVDDAADDRGLTYPSHVTFKFHHGSPLSTTIEDNFYYDLSKVNKKRPKYGAFEPDEEVDHLRGLGHLFGQVPASPSGNYGGEDVKPVTEIIEDDLMYDFRTKTHSFG